jgi:heparin binding hemagglutinin HbhA
MASPDPIDNTPEERRQTLSDPTPLYAVLGIADAAAARIRITRAELEARTGGLDPKSIGDLTRAKISAGVDAVQTDVKAAPGQVRALPSRAQALVDEAVNGIISTYTGLADRGRSLISRIREEEATSEFEHQAKFTVTTVKAATTTTRNSAAATRTAALSTASATKKSASAASTAAKSAASSTRKTASAAGKAAKATLGKLGT